VVVLGYGNQGRAHAMNLRDSGVSLMVCTRPGGSGAAQAQADGFDVALPAHGAAAADLLVLAVPDESHAEVYEHVLASALRPGATIGVLHGMSVHFGLMQPAEHFGVVMVAPKGPGTTLRARFERGEGIPCLRAVHRESPAGDAFNLAQGWAEAIGCARAAIIDTDFATEARSDLFGEQAVLCGGVLALVRAAFEVMVRAGAPPEIAWIECGQELKQVVDLLYRRGPAGMMHAISTTAEFGAHQAAAQLDDEHLRDHFHALLRDIDSGAFIETLRTGQTLLRTQREALERHPMEEASRTVREWFPETD